jgi:microcystin-dependent protein
MEGTIGEIRLFAGTYVPQNWLECQGQLLPISQNIALFSLLGSLYGGDGKSSFGLPRLEGPKTDSGAALKYIICLRGYFPQRNWD